MTTRRTRRAAQASLLVLILAAVAAPVLATLEEGKPPYVVFDLNSQPIVGENNYAHANAYAKALAVFLTGKTYVGKWRQDKGWRTTANMRIVITGVNTTTGEPAVVVEYPDRAATHGLVQIFYSPGIFAWLLNGKTGPINDGEMIVKAQASDSEVAKRIAQILLKENAFTDPTATYQLYENGFFKTTVKVKDKDVSIAEAFHTEGYPTMVKMRDGAYDGWFWFDGQFYEGKSAWSGLLTGDKEPLPSSPNDGWDNKLFDAAPTDKSRCYAVNAQKGWQCPPTYPTGGGVGAVIPMTTGFAPYCLNCHASAAQETTFADLANIDLENPVLTAEERRKVSGLHVEPPLPLSVEIVWEPQGGRDAVELGTHADDPSDDPSDHKYTKLAPLATPNPKFVQAFPCFTSAEQQITWEEIWGKRFPAKTYDHIVAKNASGKNAQPFVTSDQCVGCHAASGTTGKGSANMEVAHKSGKPQLTVDISPYGEWQTSMMGLAGRDPVFFTQVQSEAVHYGDAMGQTIFDQCMYCHGAMGRRLWQKDGKTGMTRAVVDSFAYHDPDNAKYGSGNRDGISCLICHTMEPGMGVQKDGNDSFFKGTSTFASSDPSLLYGPYQEDDLLKQPMMHGLGIEPKEGAHLKSSQLCGSCHVVRLPVLQGDGRSARAVRRPIRGESGVVAASTDKPGIDVDGKPVKGEAREDGLGNGMRHYEQTTFFEWQNSDYHDHGSKARTCQGCHMPTTYHGQALETKIANIQDDAAADVHGRLEAKDVTLEKRRPFSRHSLNGLNAFLLEMFQQFPLILGIQQTQFQNYSGVLGPFLAARERVLEFAQQETATVEVTKVEKKGSVLEATVKITNKAGHFFPTGVALRRAFVEFLVLDNDDEKVAKVLWGSGRTNEVGQLLDDNGAVLPSDNDHLADPQPHYQEITAQNQAQVYEEVIKSPQNMYTYSFLGIWESVKENRIRPSGFMAEGYTITANTSTYDGDRHLHTAGTGDDPDYVGMRANRKLWGGDSLIYKADLKGDLSKAQKIKVTLYYQTLQPRWLKEMFTAGEALGKEKGADIRRLYFLMSHLNTGESATEKSPIKNWKLEITSAVKAVP